MKCLLLVTVLGLISFAMPVLAQTPCEIEVDSGDNPLNITGFLGLGQEDTFVDNLRLTAPCEGGVDRFYFLPSDLKREGGTTEIGRQNVTLVGEPMLEANVPKDFQVKVSGVTVPGTYSGTIRLLLPNQTLDKAQIVDMQVVAKVQPALTRVPSTGLVQLRLVNCSGGLDCPIAGLVLNRSAFLEETTVRFNNEAQAPVKVTAARAVVVEEQTQSQLTDEQLGLPLGEHTFPPQQVSGIPLTVDRQDIPAGHYTGSIYLTLEDATQQMQVPVDLSVRIGPLIPLLLLLVGIILGRLVKYMQERGAPQSEALARVYQVQRRIETEAEPEDQKILIPMVESVRQIVYRGNLQAVAAELQAIEDRLQAMKELRTIEARLEDQQGKPGVPELLKKVSQVRWLLADKEDAKAKELLGKVKEELRALQDVAVVKNQVAPEIIAALLQPANTAEDSTKRAAKLQEEATNLKDRQDLTWWERLWHPDSKSLISAIFGLSPGFRAEATLWIVRPLLYLVLLVGLVVIGLSSLYVDKGTTLGTSPFADYLSLILWGLGSDVAGRSLANLRGGSVQT